MKPIKAWAVVKNGRVVVTPGLDAKYPHIWYTKAGAKIGAGLDGVKGYELVRVEIREVKK